MLGMVVFHLSWDLRFFGLTNTDPSVSLPWRLFGHAVASAFLFLSGVSLTLAHRRGTSARAILRRLGVLAVAAMAITAATYVLNRDQVILFGILHCIAVGDAVALLFVRAPALVLLTAGTGAAALPLLGPDLLPPSLWWTGLSRAAPDTLDMRPLLPWVAPIFWGVVAGRFTVLVPDLGQRTLLQPLTFLGRHSLAAYLIHQPVLIGALVLMTGVTPWSSPGDALTRPDAIAFLHDCETQCRRANTEAEVCRSACHCALTAAIRRPTDKAEALVLTCSRGAAIPSQR